MANFLPMTHFSTPPAPLRLLPLQFEKYESDRYFVSNLVGDGLFLSRNELSRLAKLDVEPGDGLYERAFSKLLIYRENQTAILQLLALRMRSRMSFLRHPTALHLFVVTLRCEHSCPYCQVSRRSTDKAQFDMSEETAMKALDIALSSPSPSIKIEFQGGEPLLNFELIQKIVLAARQRAAASNKQIAFVIASNLALLTDEILNFCRNNEVSLSTSLDGPASLHNKNRPRPGGNSHELAVSGIKRAQEVLGRDHISALMTTTEASFSHEKEIIDEYLRLGLDGIFLRPLSPYGFAIKTKQFAKYDTSEWLAFFERGLRYILDLNKQGTPFREFYSSLLLQRILTDRPIGFVDLRSPAGTGLGAIVYNYDGRVFASDEGRMLAEMGDATFELGNVAKDDYQSLIFSDKLIDIVGGSLTQSSPQCSTCAYEPVCGSDPVFHHATQADTVGIKPLSGFCARQKGILGLLLSILEEDSEDASILRNWVLP